MKPLSLVLLAGCAGFGTTIESNLVNCTGPTIQGAFTPANVTAIADALSSPNPASVEPALEAVGLAAGADALFCLVGQAVQNLEAAHVITATTKIDPQIAITRGEIFLHSWRLNGKKLTHRRVH